MLAPAIHWVNSIQPHRLALMARPRGGEDLRSEIFALRQVGIEKIVSLLEPGEIRELELKDESRLCSEHGIDFVNYSIPDRSTPQDRRTFNRLVSDLTNELVAGKSIAVHCRAGIGRTGMVAGSILYLLGHSWDDVFGVLSNARGVSVPDTPAQAEWVKTNVVPRGAA